MKGNKGERGKAFSGVRSKSQGWLSGVYTEKTAQDRRQEKLKD